MFKSKLLLLAGLVALSFYTAAADTVSDRITVTVRGKGPDVILIPGLTCSAAVWDATAAHLEAHYRLLMVQVAGFGGLPAKANATGRSSLAAISRIRPSSAEVSTDGSGDASFSAIE